ncbi:MAG TPA: Fe-S cluster assembly ATPase SufC [Actinobacteria bacterium]|nr:Fe-S cluster assembly ATPase SufC [Actinomycetota bacterium]
MTAALVVDDLHARLGDLEILRGVDLEVPFGEIHALMGPNGSGKSTLCHVLTGKEEYAASGSARVADVELLGKSVDERARAGLFHAFQYPVEVPGVTLDDLLGELALLADDPEDFWRRVDEMSERLRMEPFRARAINVGLSGGEKKRSEMFQLAVLSPRAAVLDEIDSGLDIDAVREVAEIVESLRSPELGMLLITHYNRILRYLRPDRIHVMVGGRIVASGGPELAERLEAEGYESFQ